MFDAAEEMSPLERAFVKAYAKALIRDADLIYCVVGLMEPDGLAMRDFVAAISAATELQKLSEEFQARLNAVAVKQQLMQKDQKPDRSQEKLLLDLFGLSFFKLQLKNGPAGVKKTIGGGWFSGKPAEWSSVFGKFYDKVVAADVEKKSSLFDAFTKLFGLFTPKTETNKLWPPIGSDLFLFHYEEYDDYEEEDDDDYDYLD